MGAGTPERGCERMEDEQLYDSSFDEGAEAIAHTAQSAYAVTAAARTGAAAAGAAAGTALAGPLGALVGTLVTSRTFWKILLGIFLFLFLWMFIIANLIGIIFSYLGFSNADSYANEAQSAQLSNLRTRIEEVLGKEEYKDGILGVIEKERDAVLEEIRADQEKNYPGYSLVVVDEYEQKLKGSLSYYLAVLLEEQCDSGTVSSFLGYSDSLGIDLSTNLSSAYDSYFEEAARTYNVPAALLKAMGMVESGFDPNAVSGVGAVGIMQLMPSTAASLGVSDPYDPRQNIMGGAKYVAQLIEQFKGYSNCLELVIAAYNAGPGAVVQYGYQIPPYTETQNHVKKVMAYMEIQERTALSGSSDADSEGQEEGLAEAYAILKEAVESHIDSFFSWSFTDEREGEASETVYVQETDGNRAEIDKAAYDQLLAQGANVWMETRTETVKNAEYTLALMLNAQLRTGSSYQYKYVTNENTFNLVLKLLELLQDGVDAVKNALHSLFSWTDFITGGSSGDSYIGNIDATGDIISYDTVGDGVKKVVYFNQGEEPWGSMSYGTSTIGAAGCGPTSMAIVISTLTGKTVTPEMTCAYSIANGEYVSGVGTAHSFPTNAAHQWGLTCERVGKDRMGDVVQSLKEGKMVVEICEAYTITGSGSGHFIVLTGVTRDGYITIADCASRERTGKVYSVETIKSYGRDLSDGAFWIIGKS